MGRETEFESFIVGFGLLNLNNCVLTKEPWSNADAMQSSRARATEGRLDGHAVQNRGQADWA